MSSRRELVRFLVMMHIADDYRNLAVCLAEHVPEEGAQCGLIIEKLEIVEALRELVEFGWTKAWLLEASSKPPEEFDHVPSLEEMEDPSGAWFYITEPGVEFLRANRDRLWPFDDEGELRKDWKPPVN